MNNSYIFLGLLMAMCLAQGKFAHAASFDCNAATHVSDIVICSNPTLSALEERYVESYQFVVSMGGAPSDQAKTIAARQMSFRRRCGADAQCIYDGLSEANRILMELGFSAQDNSAGEDSGAPESTSWQSLEGLQVDQLISLYRQFGDSCRGNGTGMHIEDCGTRAEVGDYLKRMRGWCYGKRTQSTFEYSWHECVQDSL